METNKIFQGSVLDVLKTFPDESIDCVVTSPPYYGLRDYQVEDQLGLEKTFEEYLNKMLLITTELKRVLKKTGTLWWNHGDSYASQHTGGTPSAKAQVHTKLRKTQGFCQPDGKKVFPEKSLMLQAHRLAIKMIDEQGWILRNTVIWHKPNTMPSSVKDRFTMDYEPVFFFTKSNETLYWTNEKTLMITNKQPLGIHGKRGQDWEWRDCPKCTDINYFNYRTRDADKKPEQAPQFKMSDKEKQLKKEGKCLRCKGLKKIKYNFWEGRDYWFEPQYEQYTEPLNRWGGPATKVTDESKGDEFAIQERDGRERRPNALGRNKRSVWKIPTKPFSEAHFATFPPALIETPIKAGCPEFICKKCGIAREKMFKSGDFVQTGGKRKKATPGLSKNQKEIAAGYRPKQETGYTNCGCNAGWTPGIVLDPFMGSGTTAVVAESLNRNWLGIELNSNYIKIAEKRIASVPKSLFSL